MITPSVARFNSGFEYPILHGEVAPEIIEQHISRMQQRFSLQTKSWSDEKHGEWINRLYFAVKMILSASVLLSSARYCADNNVRIAVPYLLYYSMFSSGRTLLFTCPDVDWDGGNLIKITHEREINVVSDFVVHFDKSLGEKVQEFFRRAKSYRELYSYGFPASGLKVVPEDARISTDDAIWFCKLLTELAQLNTDILELSIRRNTNGNFEYGPSDMPQAYIYRLQQDGGTTTLIDDDDWHRIAYFVRKGRQPGNLLHMMTEGQVEDFFFSWYPEEDAPIGVYSPETQWDIIFPVV